MSKINKEMAEQEFNRWCEAMDIETDVEFFQEDEEYQFTKNKRKVVKSIMLGSSVINDKGLLIFTTTRKDTNKDYTFEEHDGGLLVSIENIDGGNARMFTGCGEITSTSEHDFRSMKGSDLKTSQAIWLLLMA